MKYDNGDMDRYFQSLPPNVKAFIKSSGIEISTLGELMMIGEHFKHGLKDGREL